MPAGNRDGQVFGTDLLPTLADLCSIASPEAIDGMSLGRTLLDAAVPPPDRVELCWHFPHYHHLGLAPCGSIRAGRLKLIEWFDRTVGGAEDGPQFELYDLEIDPGEAANLAESHPRECANLAARLRDWRRKVGAQEMKPNPGYNPRDAAHAVPPPPGDLGNPFGE